MTCDKIVDPMTGEYVKLSSKIGINILKNYIKKFNENNFFLDETFELFSKLDMFQYLDNIEKVFLYKLSKLPFITIRNSKKPNTLKHSIQPIMICLREKITNNCNVYAKWTWSKQDNLKQRVIFGSAVKPNLEVMIPPDGCNNILACNKFNSNSLNERWIIHTGPLYRDFNYMTMNDVISELYISMKECEQKCNSNLLGVYTDIFKSDIKYFLDRLDYLNIYHNK